MPRFSAEIFARVSTRDPFRRKQLKRGVDELSDEGAVQLFFDRTRLERDPVLGAVGMLQFDVVRHPATLAAVAASPQRRSAPHRRLSVRVLS